MGCGRVGSSLAHSLDELGHSIVVVDQNPEAFRRLGPEFSGATVTGVGFDRETLDDAGIRDAEAFAAVSSGDNSNILAARVARETYGIPRVIARIYDPRRAEIYQRLGIPTVATVRWTADQMLRGLLDDEATTEWTDPSGNVAAVVVRVPPAWIGHRYLSLERQVGARVAWFNRYGEGEVVGPDTVHQEGDVVHVLVRKGDLSRLMDALGREPDSA